MFSILTVLFGLFVSPAMAQNVTCATRPAGDNSNACASTAFVKSQASACFNGASSPSSPVLYQCWANTTSSKVPLSIYDGSQWLRTSIIDTANHTYTVTGDAGYFGNAYSASQVGGWVNNIWAGSQYQVISPIFSVSVPTGGGATTSAARMSDTVGGGFGSIQVDRCLAYVDANPSVYPSWCRYTEGRTASGTTGRHINEESSIYNQWNSPAIDPYAVNPLDGTRNLRLDCGIGSGTPTRCSDALEIVFNGAPYYNGIVFSDDALDTSSGRIAPALALAKNHSVAWYYGTHGTPGSQSWSLYANATAPGGTIVLGNSAFNILGTGAEASTTFLYLSNTGAGLLAAGRSDGNQAALTGAASGSAPLLSATGVDTNVNLALQAKGTGAINALSRLTTIASTTDVAGLNIAPGVAPATPVNGDLWATTSGLFARINGTTQQMAATNIANTFAIGQIVTNTFSVNDAAGTSRQVNFTTAGANRFLVGVTSTAESGADSGTDFVLARFSDAGAYLSIPIFIQRSTGNVGINQAASAYALDVSGAINGTSYHVGGTAGATCNAGLSATTARTINGIVTTC